MKASLKTLMDQIVDYAGLFPPAELGMRETVQNYAAYLAGENAWALGRLVMPVSRLGEFERVAGAARAGSGGADRWRLSALVGKEWERDVGEVVAFNERHAGDGAPAMVIDSVEIKASDPGAIIRIKRETQETTFFEIPIHEDPAKWISAIVEAGAHAKARTGGVDQRMFPTAQDVVRFMERCRENGVAFKATAGLHHPLRAAHRLTYEPDSATGTMHGFLNVFLGAAFLYAGLGVKDVITILEESSSDAFVFSDSGVAWRSHGLDEGQIRVARREFSTSFGSCSFDELFEDLKGLKLL